MLLGRGHVNKIFACLKVKPRLQKKNSKIDLKTRIPQQLPAFGKVPAISIQYEAFFWVDTSFSRNRYLNN